MKRNSDIFLAGFLLFVFSVALAQQSTDDVASRPAAGRMMPDSPLIAWSVMQAPQPVQQSHPTPTPEPQPETQPSQQPTPSQPSEPGQPPSSQAPGQSHQAQPAAQTFTGTITKEGDTYVLKVSNASSYKLDNQDKAKQFEGQRVRVIGSLDMDSNLIRVQKIEPAS